MVQTTNTTTGTSTTSASSCPYLKPKAEQGWECPRCGCINAPWVRQCDCSRSNWTISCDDLVYRPEWWKDYVIYCQADDVTKNSTIYTTGGSDYKEGHTYVNVSGTQSNKVEPSVTAQSYTNPNNCHTPHYTTETVVNDGIHNFYNLKTSKETK